MFSGTECTEFEAWSKWGLNGNVELEQPTFPPRLGGVAPTWGWQRQLDIATDV